LSSRHTDIDDVIKVEGPQHLMNNNTCLWNSTISALLRNPWRISGAYWQKGRKWVYCKRTGAPIPIIWYVMLILSIIHYYCLL